MTTPVYEHDFIGDQVENEDVPAAPKPTRRNGNTGPSVEEHVSEEEPPPPKGRKPTSVGKASKKASTSRR